MNTFVPRGCRAAHEKINPEEEEEEEEE